MSDYQKNLSRARNITIDERLAHLQETVTINSGREAEVTVTPRSGATAIKHDQEKEPIALVSRVWLTGVAAVLGFGAKKYAAHNWRLGHARSRLISAALRHLLAYNEGEDTDPESGLSHLDHASCMLMFARETHDTHPELDDRYKGKKK